MQGRDAHNDPAFEFGGLVEVLRFQHGEELMDSGEYVAPHRRVGEVDKSGRGPRRARGLGDFNRSYLILLARPD
jgi:hypothetical protein